MSPGESDTATGDTDRYNGWSSKRLMAFPYFGGKVQYASKIIDRLPAHKRYIEPFAGAASVLLNKPESQIEILNDKNENVVNFFQVLRTRRDKLVEFLDATPYSRAECERWEQQFYGESDLPELDPVARAGRWFALRHMRFAGRMSRHGGFSAPGEKNEARDYRKNIDALEAVRRRLENVVLECEDFATVLDRYGDGKIPTLAYVDPPYVGNEEDYGLGGFDHKRLVEALEDFEGYWILSYRELPDALDEQRYHVESFGATNRAATTGDRKTTERLVMNFDPSKTAGFIDESTRQETLDPDGGNRYVNTGTDHEEGGSA